MTELELALELDRQQTEGRPTNALGRDNLPEW